MADINAKCIELKTTLPSAELPQLEEGLLACGAFGLQMLDAMRELAGAANHTCGICIELKLLSEETSTCAGPNGILSRPIGTLGFSVRTQNALEALGIETVGQLVSMTGKELLNTRNFGHVALRDVRIKLALKGLSLEKEGSDGEISLSTELTHVALPIALVNRLERVGIRTLAELISKSPAELLGIRGLGRTSVTEIQQALSEMGLLLREDRK